MKTLAQRFQYAREHASLTKAELARAMKISKASVTQIEDGITKSLKASTLMNLESVTGISGEWVQSGKGAPRVRPTAVSPDEQERITRLVAAYLSLTPQHKARVEAEVEFLQSLKAK